jgi:anti-sigma factor RsiW
VTNLHALTGAYALDALDADERAAFEAHLATCPECTREVASLQATVSRLGASTAVPPPPDLRAAVLAQATVTAQVPPTTSRTRAGTSPAAPEPTAAPEPAAARPRAWAGPQRWLRTAAAAAVVVALGIGGVLVVRDNQAAQLSAQIQDKAMRIMTAPDAVSYDVDLGASHVVTSTEMGAAVLLGENVPMPDDGTVYQVWMMHADGSPAPGPVFVPRDGEVMAVVEGDLTTVTELVVTEQPRGEQTMTHDFVALIEL